MVKMNDKKNNLAPRSAPRREEESDAQSSVDMQKGFRNPQKLVKLGVRIDEDLHHQASILVKQNRTTFQDVLEQALIEYVRDNRQQ